MRPALPRLLFLTLIVTFALSSAFAQTDNWLGGQGHWENAANWSNGVPVSTSDVVINAQNQANTVFLESDSAIHSLSMKSSNYQFNDFYVDGGQNFVITQQANIGFYSRMFVRSPGTTTVTNLVSAGGLTVSDNSTLKVLGNLNAAGGTELTTGGNLTVAGNLVNTGDPFQEESSAGTTTVTGQLANVGVGIHKAAMVVGSKINASSVLNSNGTISVQAGTLSVSGTLNNADFLQLITTGAVAATPTLENSGEVDIYPGTSLQVGSGMRGSTAGYMQYPDGTLTEHIYQGRTLKGSAGTMTLYQGGTVFLDGTLNIQLQSAFNPHTGTTYKIFTFDPGALSGTFANVQNVYFNNGTEMWQVIYDNADGYVALQAVPAQ